MDVSSREAVARLAWLDQRPLDISEATLAIQSRCGRWRITDWVDAPNHFMLWRRAPMERFTSDCVWQPIGVLFGSVKEAQEACEALAKGASQ